MNVNSYMNKPLWLHSLVVCANNITWFDGVGNQLTTLYNLVGPHLAKSDGTWGVPACTWWSIHLPFAWYFEANPKWMCWGSLNHAAKMGLERMDELKHAEFLPWRAQIVYSARWKSPRSPCFLNLLSQTWSLSERNWIFGASYWVHVMVWNKETKMSLF